MHLVSTDRYLVGDILTSQFSPSHGRIDKYETSSLGDRLLQWEAQLPSQLRLPPDGSLGAPYWASMLQFSYQ